MTHDRPYRPASAIEIAVDVMREEKGHQFDPGLTESFIELVDSSLVGPTRA
jgi:HD-GYP domain-containing protein (c-di-GMP phosphodiesterase class II)